jgi:hypothetical protein
MGQPGLRSRYALVGRGKISPDFLSCCYTIDTGDTILRLPEEVGVKMKTVWILNTCVVVIALVGMTGCADPEPEVVRTSDSALSSEREPSASREPMPPETRPAVVEDRDSRDMESVDRDRSNSESVDSRRSESRDSQPMNPDRGAGPLPGIKPPGGNNLNGASSGLGMAARDNASRNPGAPGQPAANRQPPPREYKLEFVAATGAKGLEVGDTIPEVSGKDLDNIKFKLSDYQGKVVMLDFWGDW